MTGRQESCDWVVENLGAFIDRELEPPERERVEKHVLGCAACRRLEQDLRRDWELLGSLPGTAPADPGRFLALVMRRLRDRRRVRAIRWAAGIAAAAAALLAAVTWQGAFGPEGPIRGSGPGSEDPSIIQNFAVLKDLQSETADLDPELLRRILRELDPVAQRPDSQAPAGHSPANAADGLEDILNLLLEEELEG